MGSGIGERQRQNIVLDKIDQQPIRLNMTFTKSFKISVQCMVMIIRIEFFTIPQNIDNLIQKVHIQPALLRTLIPFFVSRSELDAVFHSSNAFFKSSILS